jgi:hypothetical protein
MRRAQRGWKPASIAMGEDSLRRRAKGRDFYGKIALTPRTLGVCQGRSRFAKTALIRFGDDGVEHQVGVRVRRFRNGGLRAMLVCPRCGGARRLRLLDDKPACDKCVRASRLRYRVESTAAKGRHLLTVPERIARL